MLLRLIKDGKVVGFEWHTDGGKNYPDINIYHSPDQGFWNDIKPVDPERDHYIPHDRKDLYTGIDIDGEKVFENDYLEEIKPKPYYCIAGVVQWNPKTLAWSVVKEGVGKCSLCDMLKSLEYFKECQIKITAPQGVDNEES